jgi:hypothetical protein
MVEIVGQALGEYGNQHGDELLAEVRQLTEAAGNQLREEFTHELNQLRNEIAIQGDRINTHGAELKAQLDEIIARKRRARTAAKPNGNGSALLLPAPLADASLAPRTNGDGRS